tara:strand:- start:3957 stop:4688 length:732 start_codon:yes stop_codon:yes gene_type:complete
MATAAKKETNIVTMKDVIFMFTSVSRAIEQLNTDNKPPISAPTSPTFGLEFHSYEIKILMTEERYKKLKKEFKGAKNLPNAKEHEKADLLEKYDFLNEADLADDMVLVKFSQSALVGKADKNGVRRESYPVTQIGVKGKVQDAKGLTVAQDTSVGNGSKGHFQFKPVEGVNGLYLYPHLVCITDLIEYVGGDVEEDLDSLGLEDLDETNVAEAGQEAAAAQEAAAPEAQEAPAADGSFKDPIF